MSKIFQQQQQWSKRPPRNNFDLSFDNNFTTKIGQLTPVLIKECMPGDKFQIDASIGLRAMPLAFPVQSPVQAHLSYFWVPNRILWNNWKDFVSDTQEHEHPYISIPYTRASEIGTSTLADYLGVPTTYADPSGSDVVITQLHPAPKIVPSSTYNIEFNNQGLTSPTDDPGVLYSDLRINGVIQSQTTQQETFRPIILTAPYAAGTGSIDYEALPMGYHYASEVFSQSMLAYFSDKLDFLLNGNITLAAPNGLYSDNHFVVVLSESRETRVNSPYFYSGNTEFEHDYYNSYPIYHEQVLFTYDAPTGKLVGQLSSTFIERANSLGAFYITIGDLASDGTAITLDGTVNFGNQLALSRKIVSTIDCSPIYNPFVIQEGDTVPDIKLNALPFRAYEAIYNSFYRNQSDVDPFLLNGQKQYNRWNTNLNDGADSTTPLYLRNVNYELDYLTSALLSPQFGDAPLVGVSAIGTFTFEDENGQTYKVIPRLGDDGNTLTGIDSYQEGTPVGSLQRLNNLIKYGISISDFRNVNSLQRFAENHLRRGLKYEDVVKSHYGTDMKYTSVDEPLFLGGMTRTISVTQINATAQSDGIKLGDYVGQAGLFSKQKHNVNYYCDEHGFIIGLLSIVPIPTYSQLLPKMYLKDNLLSYPFPLEFRHIGLQPIDYREVTPIQAKLHEKSYTDTFGYQRPYYDLIASVDENHANFRTDLQGYVFTRNFAEPPELGKKFITVNPEEMTNPFIDISASAPTFLGQIHFDIKAKRPLARIHVPALE